MENAAVNEEVKENVQAQPQEEQGSTIEEITQEALNKLDKSIEFCEKLKATIKADSANANCLFASYMAQNVYSDIMGVMCLNNGYMAVLNSIEKNKEAVKTAEEAVEKLLGEKEESH